MAIDLYGQITVRLQLARVSLCKGAGWLRTLSKHCI